MQPLCFASLFGTATILTNIEGVVHSRYNSTAACPSSSIRRLAMQAAGAPIRAADRILLTNGCVVGFVM
jgi:hypothetical protein